MPMELMGTALSKGIMTWGTSQSMGRDVAGGLVKILSNSLHLRITRSKDLPLHSTESAQEKEGNLQLIVTTSALTDNAM